MKAVRIGQGFDVHRFTSNGPLHLCGVEIACDLGLEGHSDADVALHALTDAVLGAVAAGDIGEHFPPADPQWQGASSGVFLRHAVSMAEEWGFRVVNCDLTIIGERPKIAPHRQLLRESIASLLDLSVDVVSIKATTTEGLGFTGRGEGLAALAVVLLEAGDGE